MGFEVLLVALLVLILEVLLKRNVPVAVGYVGFTFSRVVSFSVVVGGALVVPKSLEVEVLDQVVIPGKGL